MPTCPVFTRAKIKSRFGIKVNSSRHTILFIFGLFFYTDGFDDLLAFLLYLYFILVLLVMIFVFL